MAQTNLKQTPNQNFGASSPSRSLSQPSFMVNNCLPPLSPYPPNESSLASPNLNLRSVSVEEMDVSSRGPAMGLISPRENPFRGSGLPPRRGHRRSNSDVPLGFSAMIQSSPQLVPISSQGMVGKMVNNTREKLGLKNYVEEMGERKSDGEIVDNLFESLMELDCADSLNACGAGDRDKDTIVRGTKVGGGDSTNHKSENVVRRNAGVAVAPQLRHYRSLSMDSGTGNFGITDQFSPSNSLSENSTDIHLEFGHGEFNEVELKKIRADERLTDIAVSDPKRAKRILANRQSAARSKERKLRYISELEHKVQTLQTESTALSAQITVLQKEHAEFTNQNNELKFRIHAMEQQAQLRDALHETLTAEVQRLKLASMELRGGRTSNGTTPTKNISPLQRQTA